MRQYIIKRLLLMIPTLLLVTLLVFALIRLIPGDVVNLMLSEQSYAADMNALRHLLGLDRPFHEQYLAYFGQFLTSGDLGTSLWTGMPVLQDIMKRLPVSFELGLLSLIISLIISIPLGVLAAVRQDSWADYITRSAAIALLSFPGFWLATIVIVIPSILFKWAPPTDYYSFQENPVKNLQQFLLPALIMGTNMSAGVMRMTRSMMLEVLRQDYIRTAWSKGLRERVVIFRHALKNAMIPVATILGMQMANLLGGSVIMEQIFVLPGVGRFMLDAVIQRDYPVIQGVNLLLAVVIVLMNLIVDITYGYLDPRIRYS